MFTKASSLSQQVNILIIFEFLLQIKLLIFLKVTLFLSTEYPLMVEYKLENLGVLRFYLAPRISDDK